MSMKFTQIPANTFEQLVLNAGILVDSFTPASGTIGNILGATTGGITFNSNPTFEDWGEDVDNCPNNTMELKRLTGYDPAMSGNFVTVNASVIGMLIAAGTVTGTDGSQVHVVPRQELESTDFKDVWWIGDYSDKNTGNNAGYLAIHLMHALNTSGFQITSSKNSKDQMAFDFHGHYSIDTQDVVPFEIYMKQGSA